MPFVSNDWSMDLYRQKDLTYITRNIHVKYQSSSTQCLKVRFRQIYRMKERRNNRMTNSCKYRFLFYIKKKPSLSSKSFSESMIKATLLSLQIYVQKYLKAVGGWEKCWQNLCRNCFYLHDTNHLYPNNLDKWTFN